MSAEEQECSTGYFYRFDSFVNYFIRDDKYFNETNIEQNE